MILKTTIAALALLSVGFVTTVQAEDKGSTSPYDYRIRTVEYNPMDTVQINGVVGIAIHVIVAPDEKYVTHVFGEQGGWAFSHVGNNFFFRPQAEESDTNLTIVTDKHSYNLLLHYVGNYKTTENGKVVEHFIHTPWTMRQATVELKYTYPRENLVKAQHQIQQERVDTALEHSDRNATVNLRYRMTTTTSTTAIEPLNIWDNFNKTFFKFPRNAPLPTIFAIGPDGKESVVNVNVEGDFHNILVAGQTAKQWRIRYGAQVVGVVNDDYNPSIGGNTSGTVSTQVQRTMKKDDGGGS